MIREPGHGESHTALRVCLILGREGAQTAELGGASLIAELIISTRDGSATGTLIPMLGILIPMLEGDCMSLSAAFI